MQISVQVAKQILILFWQVEMGIDIGEQRIGTGKAVFSCISGDPRNADGVYYQLTSGKSEMQTHFYVFWAALMQMEFPRKKSRPGRDVGCCLSLF